MLDIGKIDTKPGGGEQTINNTLIIISECTLIKIRHDALVCIISLLEPGCGFE